MDSVLQSQCGRPKRLRILALASSAWLHLRLSGGGPRYVKLGRSVAYLREELDTWLRSKLRTSTSDSAQAAA